VKQKGQASADFLGVIVVSRKVVSGCCIPTTTLTGSTAVSGAWMELSHEKGRSDGRCGLERK
jgi:hypothetical protein